MSLAVPWVRLAGFFEYFALKHARLVTLTTSRLIIKVKGFRKPVFVIPNYPLKTFGTATVSRAEFRRRYGCREGDSVVLFVGKLTHVEGADLLPKIMEDVLKNKTDVVFWIVGDGPLYPLLEEFRRGFMERLSCLVGDHIRKSPILLWLPMFVLLLGISLPILFFIMRRGYKSFLSICFLRSLLSRVVSQNHRNICWLMRMRWLMAL